MGRYVISDHLNFAARGEFLATHYERRRGVSQTKQGEVTVMLGIDVGKNFELRPEVRGRLRRQGQRRRHPEGGTKSNAVTGDARGPHLVLAAASPVKT